MSDLLKKKILKLADDSGAADAGISPVDRLNNFPSMDASYLLPSAKSIISVMLPLDGDIIRRYLGKEDHEGFQRHETDVYKELYRICKSIEEYLISKGNKAVVCEPNLDYRYKNNPGYRSTPAKMRQSYVDWMSRKSGSLTKIIKRFLVNRLYHREANAIDWNLTPSFSHRYGAVAAGIGAIGWSGNVLTPQYGARVLFNTVITDAEIESSPMIKKEICDGCKICTRVCQVGMIHPFEKAELKIGGRKITHARKGHNIRCTLCCAGFTGQSKYKSWSTWSPGRIDVPETDQDIVDFWNDFVKENLWAGNYYSKVLSDLVFHVEHGFVRKPYSRFMTTCGNCQLVCWKSRKERKENYEILVKGGQVVLGENFSFRVIKK